MGLDSGNSIELRVDKNLRFHDSFNINSNEFNRIKNVNNMKKNSNFLKIITGFLVLNYNSNKIS